MNKLNLKKVDTMMCFSCLEGFPIDHIDIFFRANRGAELKLLAMIPGESISAERAIPDYLMRKYGKHPVGMFQFKYTGGDNLYARIILDAINPEYENPRQERRRKTKDEMKRMKKIISNEKYDNHLNDVIIKNLPTITETN